MLSFATAGNLDKNFSARKQSSSFEIRTVLALGFRKTGWSRTNEFAYLLT
jgi:hypothetical protein